MTGKCFRRFIFATIAALYLSNCQANSLDNAEPAHDLYWPVLENPAPTNQFTQLGLASLKSRMEKFVIDGHVAGISTLLVHDGQVIQYNSFGITNPDTQQPVSQDTIFRIYSMTKPVTSVAMMILYEDGEFELNDPITKFIPEFNNLKVLASDGSGLIEMNRPPTLREVMSNMAGFAYGLVGTDQANSALRERKILRSPDLDTFIQETSQIPLLFQPGTYWSYSISADIQGAVIERISGQTLDEFFEERIFRPLNMDDTGFFVPENQYHRFSDVFSYDPQTLELRPDRNSEVAFKKETIAMMSGGGGLVSTMDDYARFCQMLANGGSLSGTRILKPKTVRLMRRNVLPDDLNLNMTGHLSEKQVAGMGFGLNFGVIYDAEASPTPYGKNTFFWGGKAGTWFWIDPENDLFFIGMIQRFSQNGPRIVFRDISSDYVYRAMQSR